MTASERDAEKGIATGWFRLRGARQVQQEMLEAEYYGRRFALALALLVAVFVIALFWPWIFVTVPAGHVAVKWYRFLGGTDTAHVYGEGSRLIFPWNKVVVYEARVQQINRDFDVLTSDGLTMTINIAVRFRINEATVGGLHKFVGPDYVDRLIIPAVGAYARQVLSQNSTDAIYTTRRASIQQEVKQAVIADLSPRAGERAFKQDGPWLFVEDLLIRSMRFPPAVQAAVDRKMEQYQLKQEYAYRLERERLESERKEVEAHGIARFQSIVSTGISESYLRWKGIDATLALAQSPNAKLVMIGSAKDGMPIILGGDTTTSAHTAPPPPSPPMAEAVAGGTGVLTPFVVPQFHSPQVLNVPPYRLPNAFSKAPANFGSPGNDFQGPR
jgi:regulator of protease activity HflC (stomatin/prohibitin superfamily)